MPSGNELLIAGLISDLQTYRRFRPVLNDPRLRLALFGTHDRHLLAALDATNEHVDKYASLPSRNVLEYEAAWRLLRTSPTEQHAKPAIQDLLLFTDILGSTHPTYAGDKLIERLKTRLKKAVEYHAGNGKNFDQVAELVREFQASLSITASAERNPLSDITLTAKATKQPVGVKYLDDLLGGVAPGDYIVLTGPTGGGKTLCSVDIFGSVVLWQQHAMYFTYEQPVEGDIARRVTARILEIKQSAVSNVSRQGTEESRRLQERAGLHQYVHMYDMQLPESGRGGTSDIDQSIERLRKDGIQPRVVIVDWLIPLMERASDGPKTDGQRRDYAYRVSKALKDIAVRHSTLVILVHQLATQESRKSPKYKPRWTDSAEFKNINWVADYSLALGVVDEQTECCWLVSSKGRSSKPSSRIIRRNWDYAKFDLADDMQVSLSRLADTAAFRRKR